VSTSESEVEMLAADAGYGTRLMLAIRGHLNNRYPGQPVVAYARTAWHARAYLALLNFEQPNEGLGLPVTPGAVSSEP